MATPRGRRRRALLILMALTVLDAIAIGHAIAMAEPDAFDLSGTDPAPTTLPPAIRVVPIVPPGPQLRVPPADRTIGC